MRGNIFEINKDIEELGNLTYRDVVSGWGCSAEWLDDADSPVPIAEKISQFTRCGIETGVEVDPDGIPRLYFVVTSESRKDFFKERYNAFKKQAEQMTLDEFSENLFPFIDLIETQVGDAAYLDGTYYDSFDAAVRDLETGVRYYFGNVVGMH